MSRLKEALIYCAEHPYVITPISQMIAVQLAQSLGNSGTTQIDAEELQGEIAKILGFVAFGDAFAGITGGFVAVTQRARDASARQYEINVIQTVSSLIFAGLSIALDAVMFAPGAKMKAVGPWLIAGTFTAAALLKEFAFKIRSADRANEAAENNDETLLARFSQFAGSRLGSILTIVLPLVASNLVMQYSDSLKDHESVINSTIWLVAVLLNAIPSVFVGVKNLSVAIANAIRLTILTGVGSSLLSLMELIGSVDAKFRNAAPAVSMGVGVISMLSAAGTHVLVESRNDVTVSPIATGASKVVDIFFEGLYFLANATRFMGPQVAAAIGALKTTGPVSILLRHGAQAMTLLGVLQNLWEAGATYRHTHNGVGIEAVLIAIQVALFGAAMSDRAGNVGGHDIRPLLLIISSFFHYLSHLVTSFIAKASRAPQEARGLLQDNGAPAVAAVNDSALTAAQNPQGIFNRSVVMGVVVQTAQNLYLPAYGYTPAAASSSAA